MTDPTHGHSTGEDASGTIESYGARGIPVAAQPRFAADPAPLMDAHSPASPYTVTSQPRPARALPVDDGEPVVPVAAAAPAAPVPPRAPVAPATPFVPVPPLAQVPPVVAPVAAAPVAPVQLPSVPQAARAAAAGPVTAAPQAPPALPEPTSVEEPDDYVEPPIVPRPYAVPTQTYAPAPPSYTPPAVPAAPSVPPPVAPFQTYTSPVPAPAALARPEAPSPYAHDEGDVPPLVTVRPYAQPGYGAHAPVPGPAQGPAPAYGSVDPYASFGGPDLVFGAPAVPATPAGFGTASPRTENVGRGLLFALLAVVGGCVLSAVVYHLGFVASIVALAMGAAGIFLYSKGAGSPPRKGAVGLVVLLMAGILLAWVSSVGTELYLYYVDTTGSSNGALVFAATGALSLDVFTATLKDFLLFVGFGALGIFGVARRLLLPVKRK